MKYFYTVDVNFGEKPFYNPIPNGFMPFNYVKGDTVGIAVDLGKREAYYSMNGFTFPETPLFWAVTSDCFGFIWYDRKRECVITPFQRKIERMYMAHCEQNASAEFNHPENE